MSQLSKQTPTIFSSAAEIAKAEVGFQKYRFVQDRLYESDLDKQMKALESVANKKDLLSSGDGDE